MAATSLKFLPAHLLAAYLTLGVPWLGVRRFRRLKQAIARGERATLQDRYEGFLLHEWCLALVLAIVVFFLPYKLEATLRVMGVWWPRDWWGVILAAGSAIGVVLSGALKARRPGVRAQIAQRLESMQPLLPRSPRERQLWVAVSFTAGVCEELLYRGFLLLYFLQLFGTDAFFFGVAASAAIFGLAHWYQGPRGVWTTGMLGLLFALFVWLTGSLLSSIVLHALIDLQLLWLLPSSATPTPSPAGTGALVWP